jgi:hypothetical protein
MVKKTAKKPVVKKSVKKKLSVVKKTVKKKTGKNSKLMKHQLLFINAGNFDEMYSQVMDINDILIDNWKVIQIAPFSAGGEDRNQSALIVIEKEK